MKTLLLTTIPKHLTYLALILAIFLPTLAMADEGDLTLSEYSKIAHCAFYLDTEHDKTPAEALSMCFQTLMEDK